MRSHSSVVLSDLPKVTLRGWDQDVNPGQTPPFTPPALPC